ncbi:MAG: helix-turn-helix domain-containing protein [Planctomycetes bacterium]|nr:helix-turn-helix domain-containing protein [Planctomycetota bacterium]
MELRPLSGPDPSPALTRGLLLLKRLGADGASSLEHLAHATGWPKSSVFRLLASLEACGAVQRDPADRRYRAALRLVPFAAVEEDLRLRAVAAMQDLVRAAGHTVELFAYSGGALTMLDRRVPEDREVAVRARIGWQPDRSELFALTAAALAWGDPAPAPARSRLWYWKNQTRVPLKTAALLKYLNESRARGLAVCLCPNFHGVRRYVAPVFQADGALWGVLSLAAVPAPLKGPAHARLIRLALDAAKRVNLSAAERAAS